MAAFRSGTVSVVCCCLYLADFNATVGAYCKIVDPAAAAAAGETQQTGWGYLAMVCVSFHPACRVPLADSLLRYMLTHSSYVPHGKVSHGRKSANLGLWSRLTPLLQIRQRDLPARYSNALCRSDDCGHLARIIHHRTSHALHDIRPGIRSILLLLRYSCVHGHLGIFLCAGDERYVWTYNYVPASADLHQVSLSRRWMRFSCSRCTKLSGHSCEERRFFRRSDHPLRLYWMRSLRRIFSSWSASARLEKATRWRYQLSRSRCPSGLGVGN